MAWLKRGRPTSDSQFFVKPVPLNADDSKMEPTAGGREIGADNAERLRAEAHERVELALADHTSKQVGRTINQAPVHGNAMAALNPAAYGKNNNTKRPR